MRVKVPQVFGKKRYTHTLDHDVSTTLDYGFCQPIMAREIPADTTINFSVAQFVRLGIVVSPTFGRMHLRTYNAFVPIETVYEPFGSFIAGQSYSHGGQSYIPTQVTCTTLGQLSACVALHSKIALFLTTGMTTPSDNATRYSGVSLTKFDGQPGDPTYLDFVTSLLGVGPDCADEIVGNICEPMELEQNIYDPQADEQPSMDEFDWFHPFEFEGTQYLVAGRLTRAGRNLRSVLLGCGYQFDLASRVKVSLLPIISYYKTYFDKFNPHREVTWKDTNVYQLMESLQNQGDFDIEHLSRGASYDVSVRFWRWILHDVPLCYYTSNPDFFSAHITGTALDVATQENDSIGSSLDGPAFPFLNGQNNLDYISADQKTNASLGNQTRYGNLSDINRASLRILDELSKRINVHSAFGTRIREYLKSILGSQYLEDDRIDFLKSQSFNVDITDIYSMAETNEASLGQYAGKGLGAIDQDHAEKINFKTPTPGFLVSFICLVPETRYYQGLDLLNTHLTRRQFFDSQFDGITLLPTPKYAMFSSFDFRHYREMGIMSSFGNIPVYSENKVAQNVVNGDMSRRSTRASYQAYTLDRQLPNTRVRQIGLSSSGTWEFQNLSPAALVCGEFWRYIGRDRWNGNFDRIFLGSGRIDASDVYYTPDTSDLGFFTDNGYPDDNFIVHNRIFLKLHNVMLPLGQSFDTGADGNSSMEVEKA